VKTSNEHVPSDGPLKLVLTDNDMLLCGRAIVAMYPSDSVFSKSMVETLRNRPKAEYTLRDKCCAMALDAGYTAASQMTVHEMARVMELANEGKMIGVLLLASHERMTLMMTIAEILGTMGPLPN
jgi:hypothetical protein